MINKRANIAYHLINGVDAVLPDIDLHLVELLQVVELLSVDYHGHEVFLGLVVELLEEVYF